MVIFHSYVSLPEGMVCCWHCFLLVSPCDVLRNSSEELRGTRNCVFCPVDPTEEPQRLVSTPPKNMKVSWGYYSQYMEK